MTETAPKRKIVRIKNSKKINTKIVKEMSYLSYLKGKEINTFPIRIDLIPTKKTLEDGSVKKTKKLLSYDFAKVNVNDFDDKAKMKKRWDLYKNGNKYNYNAYAVDTTQIGVIDYDCIPADIVDGKESPFITFLKTKPYKQSASKAFGKHILFDRTEIPINKSRRKRVFPKKFGVDASGKEGIEFLDGLWEWCFMDDKIQFPDRDLDIPAIILDIKKELKMYVTKQIKEQADIPIATLVESIDQDEELLDGIWDYNIIRENLFNYKIKDLVDVQKAAGIIISCGSSQDEKVYQIVLEVMKQPGANFDSEEWVRAHWESYNPVLHKSYYNTFREKYIIKYKENYDWRQIQDSNKFIQDYCYNKYKHDFMVNTNFVKLNRRIAYFDSEEALWLKGVDVATYKIKHLLTSEVYGDLKNEWEKALKLMPSETVSEKEAKLQLSSQVERILLFFSSTGGWDNTTARKILERINQTKELQKKIQFNLEKINNKYFHFKNGAFNLKTGLLEERTREMYVTDTLDYDYTDKVNEFIKDSLFNIISQVLPEEKFREGFFKWRGYCLTGETEAQTFVLNVGETASNGKSTMSKMFKIAFPMYCKKIQNNTFDKGKGREYDKTMASMADKPIRLCYMEEWGGEEQDVNMIKNTIESNTINCQPLYQEAMEMTVTFKLEAGSNTNPDCKADGGILRRGRKFEYKSKFINKEDGDENHKEHIYYKKKGLLNNLEDDDAYKQQLFLIFAKYSKDYYENGLVLPDECKTLFAEACDEGDEWIDFFENNFEEGGENDTIHKDIMDGMVFNAFGKLKKKVIKVK